MGELGEISKWLNNQLKAENRGNFLHFLFYTLEWEIYSARMCLLLLWLAILLHCYSWIQHWIHWLLSNSSWINKSVTGTLNTGIGMADNFRWQDMLEPRFEWWSGFNLMYAFGFEGHLEGGNVFVQVRKVCSSVVSGGWLIAQGAASSLQLGQQEWRHSATCPLLYTSHCCNSAKWSVQNSCRARQLCKSVCVFVSWRGWNVGWGTVPITNDTVH